jgi:hypothetical protein
MINFGQLFEDLAKGKKPADGEGGKYALFAWFISHQPAVLFSQSKPATSNQPAVLFSQNKPAPAISHQPNEQAGSRTRQETSRRARQVLVEMPSSVLC